MLTFGSKALINVSTNELLERLQRGDKLHIIDVRDSWEYAEGHVPGSILRPIREIRNWSSELDPGEELFLICRSGSRSEVAYNFLRAKGFRNLRNVSGGIIAWRGSIER